MGLYQPTKTDHRVNGSPNWIFGERNHNKEDRYKTNIDEYKRGYQSGCERYLNNDGVIELQEGSPNNALQLSSRESKQDSSGLTIAVEKKEKRKKERKTRKANWDLLVGIPH